MKDDTEREVPHPQGSVTAADRFANVLPSRRRLITGGLAAAPILASLSTKALAADCLTPSGNLSGNVSTGAQVGACTGAAPSSYATNGNGWPGGSAAAPNAKFHSIFAKGTSGGPTDFGNAQMKQVVGWYLRPPHTVAEQLAAYFAAAYLNVLQGPGVVQIPGLNQAGLENLLTTIWADYALHGEYKVNSAVSWDALQIRTYLTSNGFAAL